jgi:hypothetical protein
VNFTPNSAAPESPELVIAGVTAAFHKLHGHPDAPVTVNVPATNGPNE